MAFPHARILRWELFVLVFVLLAPRGEAGSVPPTAMDLPGTQMFPPLGLDFEDSVSDLISWLGGILGLNATLHEVTQSRESPLDMFRESMRSPQNLYESSDGRGAKLRMYYEAESGAFVAIYYMPTWSASPTLRDFSIQTANALGINLAGSEYVEVERVYEKDDPNSTTPIRISEFDGYWRQNVGPLHLHFANQLRLVTNDDREVTLISGFRWVADLPPVAHSLDDARAAAEEGIEQLHGFRETRGTYVGIAPNYRNGTWSYLVRVAYSYDECYRRWFEVLLDAETLAFQRVEELPVPVDGCGYPRFFDLWAMVMVATVLVGGTVGTVALVLWWDRRRTRPPRSGRAVFGMRR